MQQYIELPVSSQNFSVWPIDRNPSRLEIGVGVVAVLQSFLFFSATDTPVSWLWLGVGAVVWAVAMGPITASPVGKRIKVWSEAIGIVGRLVAIVVAFAVISAVEAMMSIPTTPAMNFITGGLFATGVVILLETIRARIAPQ